MILLHLIGFLWIQVWVNMSEICKKYMTQQQTKHTANHMMKMIYAGSIVL